jgi:putative oxidoreductase
MRNIFPRFIQAAAILLGLFFMYKGITKHFLSPCKIYAPESTIPLAYQQVMTAFCESGFAKIVGFFEVLAGALLLFRRTRTLGGMVLLPLIVNIFLIHFFLDNRPGELIETGIPLTLNLLVLLADRNRWLQLLGK